MSDTNQRILFTNVLVFDPLQSGRAGWLLSEGRTIRALGFGETPQFESGALDRRVDGGGRALLPGFIDVHVHGAMGYEAMDASPAGLQEMARFYARHGVTAFLATTWTAGKLELHRSIQAIADVVGPVEGGATLLGAHLEGPYLNSKRTGAQDPGLIRAADAGEALEYLQSGLVRLVAVAPEISENTWFIRACVQLGITVSAAHTTASFEQMQAAVRLGVRQVTHCFNAMEPLGHRNPGTVGAAMAFPELSTELIADNIHVHPAVQKILLDVKGPQRLILVTDAIRATGLPDGDYPIDTRVVRVKDNAVRLPDGTLAGSILTMEHALNNLMRASGCPLSELWPTSSLNAARSIGVSAHKGSLEVGKDADLVMLNPDGSVQMTVAEGRVVFEVNPD